jgi:enediyne polyketide synthase
VPYVPGEPTDGQVTMDAVERSRTGDLYTYDVDVYDERGRLVERWEGLRLQAVRKQDGRGPWVPALLGPYLERQFADVAGLAPIAVVIETDSPAAAGDVRLAAAGNGSLLAARRVRTALAVSRAVGERRPVRYRPDGRPEIDGASMSASHGAGLTLAVVGDGPLGCDVQAVQAAAESNWAGLLGSYGALARLVAADAEEPYARAAARVWTVMECLRKAGSAVVGQATLDGVPGAGWVTFTVGRCRVATFATSLAGTGDVVLAGLTA